MAHATDQVRELQLFSRVAVFVLNLLIMEFLFLMTLPFTSRESLWLSFKSSWPLILESYSFIRVSHSYFIFLFEIG